MPVWFSAAALVVSIAAQSSAQGASAKSARKQAASQLAAERYNAQVGYATDLNNIAFNTAITNTNVQNLLTSTELSNSTASLMMQYNADLIKGVTEYNDALYEADIEAVWAQADLDLSILGQQRARERGSMIASQAASGTVIGVGSNADAIIDQMTQEAMDAFVIKTGAADKAGAITNARMQSLYSARQEIAKIEFEGNVKNTLTTAQANMQGQTMLTENYLQSSTDLTNATTKLQTGLAGAAANLSTNNAKINANLQAGMFNIASTAAQGASQIAQTYYSSGS